MVHVFVIEAKVERVTVHIYMVLVTVLAAEVRIMVEVTSD